MGEIMENYKLADGSIATLEEIARIIQGVASKVKKSDVWAWMEMVKRELSKIRTNLLEQVRRIADGMQELLEYLDEYGFPKTKEKFLRELKQMEEILPK